MKTPISLTDYFRATLQSGSMDDVLTEEQRSEQDRLQSSMPEATGGIIVPWFERRGLDVTGGTSGGQYLNATNVPEVGLGLRDNDVLAGLGTRYFLGMNGNVNLPKAKPTIVASWTSETGAQTDGTELFATLNPTPQRVSAQITVSSQFLLQNPNAEAFLRAELPAAIAEAIQQVAINGAGSGSNQPVGILGTANIGSVVGGTNGLAPTYQNLLDLEYAPANAKANIKRFGWLVSPKARRKLRGTFLNGTGSDPVWDATQAYSLLGSPAGVTTAVPDTLTKNTSVGICSALIFGNFAELFVVVWGAGITFEVLTSVPYAKAGQVLVVATAFVSTGVRSPESFAAMTDALC
jgi:HK97 family phage major capsid protein